MTDEEPEDGAAEKPAKKRRVPLDANGREVPRSMLVDAIRNMQSQGMSDGDIKRTLSKRYGMARRSFEKYCTQARERSREVLGVTAPDAKSDSIRYWSNRLQVAENTIKQATERMQDAYKRIDGANAIIDDEDEVDKRKEIAQFTLDKCTDQIETYRKQIYNATREATDFRDRLDRVLGTLAPIKHAQTDTDGNTVAPVVIGQGCEPTTMEDATRNVASFVEYLQPLGLHIVNDAGRKLLPNGTFEGDEPLLLPSP